MLQEEKLESLLQAVYKNGTLNVYDFCEDEWENDPDAFLQCRRLADELVNEKLAKYNDDQKTELIITNYGRYWIANGGYLIYLKEGGKRIKQERDRHQEDLSEELKGARLKFTHYRIVTYWWGFAITLVSFLLTLLNLYLLLRRN